MVYPDDLPILEALLQAQGRPADFSALTSDPSAAQGDIEAAAERLRRAGCRVETCPSGLRLINSGLAVWHDYLTDALRAGPKRRIEIYPRTTSTQELVKARSAESLLIFSDFQTAGRGRLGRGWLAPSGSAVLFSLTHVLSPEEPATMDRVSFVCAVAVAQAVDRIVQENATTIRWPNDILVEGRKLAGILVETVQGPVPVAVIGVGINVALRREHLTFFPAEVRDKITSFDLRNWHADRLLVAAAVINQIDENLGVRETAPLVDEWRRRNLLREQAVRLCSNGETIMGTVIDLDPDDGLIVRRQTGEIVHLQAATTSVL